MEPTPLDDRPCSAHSDDRDDHDACLSEALAWIVRLNRPCIDGQEVRALGAWCARSAVHAQAWREAVVLWQLLLPAGRELPQRRRRRSASGLPSLPSIARTAGDIRIPGRGAATGAASDPSSLHFRPRQSWS
ncbi:hypothetical protein DBV14_22935 [Variovorax sp. KBW07]|uniref:FecR/PupR family sigma factor regulator n=1 Tax=Variovorax sp. KBW07 TaxID=2153358 RepID=UPI000F56F040|nr:DUF4880 domain-containing protein [Variovorax sp. KBW07]RQO46134.1 hypothetical protein DBV14_22935 [Variovorax sp. KBW07]